MKRLAAAFLTGSLVLLEVHSAKAGPREDFLAHLKDAIRRDDMGWIGSHLSFPVTIRGKRRLVLRSRASFTAFDPALIGPKLRADILAEKPEDLFLNWQGMMIGSGQHNVWVCDVSPDPAKPDYRIFAMIGAN
ncbi:hypothetical protein LMIY3S_00938 [Labrys miyagiensis]